MEYNQILQKEQEAIRLENTIDSFFSDFQVGRLLNGAGIRKMPRGPAAEGFCGNFPPAFRGEEFLPRHRPDAGPGIWQGCSLRPAAQSQAQLAQADAGSGGENRHCLFPAHQ